MGDGMKTKLEFHRRWSRLALNGAAAVVLVVGMAQTALAAEDGEDDAAPDTKFFRNILSGLGLRQDGSGIDYRERSPLVVPPDRNLPPPEKSDVAAKNPAWPKDEDLQRAKKAKAERKAYNEEPEVRSRVLTPAELNPNGAANRTRADSLPKGGASATPDGVANQESPSLLGFKGWGGTGGGIFAKSEEYTTFKTEPTRENLTDPPVGYRTPSPNQPYGVGKQKWTPNQVPAFGEVVK
jgi:hypothetical protein